VAELDFERQERLRRELPALQHARLPLAGPAPGAPAAGQVAPETPDPPRDSV